MRLLACDSSHVNGRLLCKAPMHSLAALFDIALGNLRVRFAQGTAPYNVYSGLRILRRQQYGRRSEEQGDEPP